MKLTSVREDDIVEVNIKGRRFFAQVSHKDQTGVTVKPITPGITWQRATARQIIGHWRKSRQTATTREAAHVE